MNAHGSLPRDWGVGTTGGSEVLGIPVAEELLARWRDWWAPERQPFPVGDLPADQLAALPEGTADPGESDPPSGVITDEVRDSFFVYGGTWRWLTQAQFGALPSELRRSLIAARRRWSRTKPAPPWPTHLRAGDEDRLLRWVAAGATPSRHHEIGESTWSRAATVLPQARNLAGTFADGSGPNCFGTVMAAAGVPGAAEEWMTQEPFEAWLAATTTKVRGTAYDRDPGVVLLWHEHGELAHAAVTIGDGWALSKPSQSWSSPRLVWTTRRTISSWTYAGTRLSRRRLG
ncbi:hypothetical protein [Ornithinimicrobium sp. Y1694]|uniref:hypothetical protein n=1 Tax=Ornithinimicrobium sp. Y1694 TaxID=3418590 RepID=UPI003CF8F985